MLVLVVLCIKILMCNFVLLLNPIRNKAIDNLKKYFDRNPLKI